LQHTITQEFHSLSRLIIGSRVLVFDGSIWSRPMPVKRHPVAVSDHRDPLARLPLDTALVGRLRATYERVRVRDHRLAEIFYAKLFGAAPHLRSLFKSEPKAQAEKLMAALDAVVRNLEQPAENAAMLVEMGKRHAQYGAKPEHYALVTDLLVQSMQELLDAEVEPPALEEWRLALRLISNQMIVGAEGAARGKGDEPRRH
jgi:hemoglobin-like flavoprotein